MLASGGEHDGGEAALPESQRANDGQIGEVRDNPSGNLAIAHNSRVRGVTPIARQ
jgi:hypothetical protein